MTLDRMETIKSRLTQLVISRPFVFKDTAKRVAERYLQDLLRFEGLPENDVLKLERAARGKCSDVLRQYLLTIGMRAGALFRGSDVAFVNHDVTTLRTSAEELLRDSGEPFKLEDRDFVFLLHQGYTFCYLSLDGGEDSPVYQYVEGDKESQVVSPTFLQFIEAEVRAMEETNSRIRENGGYFLTILPGGGQQETHPALSSGIRPMDFGDVFT